MDLGPQHLDPNLWHLQNRLPGFGLRFVHIVAIPRARVDELFLICGDKLLICTEKREVTDEENNMSGEYIS